MDSAGSQTYSALNNRHIERIRSFFLNQPASGTPRHAWTAFRAKGPRTDWKKSNYNPDVTLKVNPIPVHVYRTKSKKKNTLLVRDRLWNVAHVIHEPLPKRYVLNWCFCVCVLFFSFAGTLGVPGRPLSLTLLRNNAQICVVKIK